MKPQNVQVAWPIRSEKIQGSPKIKFPKKFKDDPVVIFNAEYDPRNVLYKDNGHYLEKIINNLKKHLNIVNIVHHPDQKYLI